MNSDNMVPFRLGPRKRKLRAAFFDVGRMIGNCCSERSCGQCFHEALDREEAREREKDGGRESA